MGVAATLLSMFALTSPAFGNGGTIARRYTCDGANVSPALRWTAPPRGTRRLSLLVVDVDAAVFVHWRVDSISPRTRSFAVGAQPAHQGLNGFGTRGWSGPCPPPGPAHHYIFMLKAFGANGRELGEAGLIARYARR